MRKIVICIFETLNLCRNISEHDFTLRCYQAWNNQQSEGLISNCPQLAYRFYAPINTFNSSANSVLFRG